MAKVSTPDFFLFQPFLTSPVFPVNQAKKLKTGGRLQFWWPSGLFPCVWNPMILQTRVQIPQGFFPPLVGL